VFNEEHYYLKTWDSESTFPSSGGVNPQELSPWYPLDKDWVNHGAGLGAVQNRKKIFLLLRN
jgi:hypothetical protein